MAFFLREEEEEEEEEEEGKRSFAFDFVFGEEKTLDEKRKTLMSRKTTTPPTTFVEQKKKRRRFCAKVEEEALRRKPPEAKRVRAEEAFDARRASGDDDDDDDDDDAKMEVERVRIGDGALSVEKKIPPLGKEALRKRVPTLDALCKKNGTRTRRKTSRCDEMKNEDGNEAEEKEPSSSSSSYSLASHDLVKGKYEGGLKLWECAIDLTEYLVRERVVEEMVSKSSKTKPFRVLELGCGHGVPGIASLMVHKKDVTNTTNTILCTLADYNEEVLKEVTIPNARLNGVCDQCTFLAGDWDDLIAASSNKSALLLEEEFDLILSSDTIYNVEDAKKLAKVIHHCLKRKSDENAIALVAAKRYYFGVGGSTATFMKLCDDAALTCDVVKEIMDGASNVREIIRVRIKNAL